MTYASNEKSVANGTPFECYKFETPVGEFRYTSLPFEETVGGEVYVPGTIVRGPITISAVIDSIQQSEIKIPVDYDIAKTYLGPVVPEYFTVTILRAHYGDDLATEYTVEWYGEAISYGQDSGMLVVGTQSILQAKVMGAGTTVYCQLTCNHRVYDARCKLDPADFTEIAVVTKVDNILITVDVVGHPADELPLGRLVNTRTGEERTIHVVNGKTITVTYPYLDIVVGDVMHVILGCDNRMETCLTRFNNIPNFGGHKYVPLSNPFEGL